MPPGPEHQCHQFTRVVLPVPINRGNPRAFCRGNARAQPGGLTTAPIVRENAQVGQAVLPQLAQHGHRVIPAAVVYKHDFRRGEALAGFGQFAADLWQVILLVQNSNNDAQHGLNIVCLRHRGLHRLCHTYAP